MEELYACAQEGRATNVEAIVKQLLEDTAPHPLPEWQLFAQTRLAVALSLAAWNDHKGVVDVVLASLGLPAFVSAVLYEPYNARNALTTAARHGRTSILDLFTQNLIAVGDLRGADRYPLDLRMELNDALSAAVLGGVCDDFPGVAQVLVAAKADPTRFLADVAGGCGDADMLRALIAHKANVREEGFRAASALHCAIEFNLHPTEVVSQLLEAKADPDVQNLPWTWSPLNMAASKMMASKDDRHSCIDLLLDAKAAVNGINGNRPIIAAITGLDAPTVRKLLSAKSAVDWPCDHTYPTISALNVLLNTSPRTGANAKTVLSITRTLIAVKAVVDQQHVIRAAANHCLPTITAVFHAHPDRVLAAKLVLTNVNPRHIMKAFVEDEMGGDVSSVDTAQTGELIERHAGRKGSKGVLRVLLAAKATLRIDEAIVSAVSSNDPGVLDVLQRAGARADKQILELARAKANTYGYTRAHNKICAMLAMLQALDDDDQDRPPKLKRMC